MRERLTSAGVEGLTVTEVVGYGRQKGTPSSIAEPNTGWTFTPKLLLTILAREDLVDGILNAIIEGARTGKIGDGKVFVTTVDEVVRIRTGETGETAI